VTDAVKRHKADAARDAFRQAPSDRQVSFHTDRARLQAYRSINLKVFPSEADRPRSELRPLPG
jgi:hypothetical protein